MNWKILLLLVAIAAAAVLAAYQIQKPQLAPQAQIDQGQQLFPDLSEKLNDVKTIRVATAGDTTVAELEAAEDGWILKSRGGYPASFTTIRAMLIALADASIVEQKTANPENYGRLGVSDISATDAAGKLVEISSAGENWSILIGNNASGGAGGTYVRRAGEAPSLLISESVNVPAETVDWLQQPLLNIPGDRIQRAVVQHPNGDTVTVVKENRSDENFSVFNLLSDRELSYDTVGNPTGHGITTLDLDDVVPAADISIPAQVVNTDYFTFDGLKISVSLFQQDEINYAALSASYDATQAERYAETGANTEADSSGASGSDDNSGQKNAEDKPADVSAEADTLDQRLRPWVFSISDFKYRNMTKTLEDFLKPLPEPDAGAAAGDQSSTQSVSPQTGSASTASSANPTDSANTPGAAQNSPSDPQTAPVTDNTGDAKSTTGSGSDSTTN